MGNETRKCYEKRLARGDFDRYLVGRGLDIGSGDDPLRAPHASVEAWDLPEGDAEGLLTLRDATYDFVYSSHCLEHMRSVETALRNWVRVLKPGGYLYLAIPDFTLYEKELFPSRFNSDHKHTFSLEVSRSRVSRSTHWNIEEDLVPLLRTLGVSVVEAFLEDDGYNRGLGSYVDQTHSPNTLAQLCIIGRKEGRPEGDAPPRSYPDTEVAGGASAPAAAEEPIRIYTGILGQIGDIVMFTPTLRRLKELFPKSRITFAVSRRYREAGELIAGLPYVDRLFVAESYFERMTPRLADAWHGGWPVDLRGEDEVREERQHDLVFETRPRWRRMPWWEYAHQVEESAHRIGVPGPIDLQTEIAIPPGTTVPEESLGKVVLHNDPAISAAKAWKWELLLEFVQMVGPRDVVLLGNPGPPTRGVLDLRGRTTLAQAAAIIAGARCYVGIDSGLMWVAGSLQIPAVGLYGTSYIPAFGAIQPRNPQATYLQVEGNLDSILPERVLTSVREKLDLAAR